MVIKRRRGEVAVNAGDVLLLHTRQRMEKQTPVRSRVPSIIITQPSWPSGEESINGSKDLDQGQSCVVDGDADTRADQT